MDPLDIARWQFGIITVYHFLFVPITIGLSAMVAGYETAWVRTGNPNWLRLTKFFGKLFLINFAIGVVTGIVQEFQFGMNWSDYSRFVGDIFGAPLAIEGLLAFFLESTFLGLWIFGWDRLPAKVHAACIWIVHVGTLLSAYFILAANSWMQHPVGYTFNPDTGRAELTDFAAVLFNKVQLVTFPHTVLAAYMTGAAFVVGVAFWHLVRATTDEDREMYRRAVRTGAAVVLVSGLGVAVSGDIQGKIMTEVQPMKMAAAEALYTTEEPASFSLFTIGSLDGQEERFAVKVPEPAVVPGHRQHHRPGRGHQRAARAVRGGVRQRPRRGVLLTGRLHPDHPDHLLDLPADDRPRPGRRRDRRLDPLGHPPRTDPDVEGAAVARDGAAVPAAVRQLVRLDLHRDGPPALGRLRADDHRERRLPGRPRRRGAHLADRASRCCTACWRSSRSG